MSINAENNGRDSQQAGAALRPLGRPITTIKQKPGTVSRSGTLSEFQFPESTESGHFVKRKIVWVRGSVASYDLRLGRRLNGSRTATPAGSKSDTLRVTTLSPCSSAVAAIMKSAPSSPKAALRITATPYLFNIPRKVVAVIPSANSAAFGANSVFRTAAPRSMKMGTIRSPYRYDAAACHALQSVTPRRPAILHYA
jgi:hypothetical protein